MRATKHKARNVRACAMRKPWKWGWSPRLSGHGSRAHRDELDAIEQIRNADDYFLYRKFDQAMEAYDNWLQEQPPCPNPPESRFNETFGYTTTDGAIFA